MLHLRLSGQDRKTQRAALLDIVQASPHLMSVFQIARDMDLPDWWIVSGAIYNTVWNHLTGRPEMNGVKDIDLFYFDTDTSWEAEDKCIKRALDLFPQTPPVELRNQARVHLWYKDHFGVDYAPLSNSCDAIDRFASITHCVGLRLFADDSFDIYAPYGLDDIFSFRIVPNATQANRETHERKAQRQKALWPELEVFPWLG